MSLTQAKTDCQILDNIKAKTNKSKQKQTKIYDIKNKKE